MATNKHILVALVEDKPGVLNRMASLFRRRSFNIESIAVGHSEMPHMSRMTFVVNGSATVVEQVRKQLDKVVETVKVSDITGDNVLTRELAFIKVKANSANRSEIIQIVDIFRANIVDVSPDSVIIEATGDEEKINSLFNLVRGFGIKEISRTGCIAMTRGGSGPLPVMKKPPKTQAKGPKKAVAATFVYSFVVTLIIGKVIDITIGLRVSDKEEAIGLDQALHEESAYHI